MNSPALKPSSPDTAEIKRMLADRAESVAAYLLPAGKQVANEWKAGDVSGGAGNSLSVHLTGDKAGVWMDFATGECGDLLDLWKAVSGCDFPTALCEASEWLGMAPMPSVQRPKAKAVSVFNDPPAGVDSVSRFTYTDADKCPVIYVTREDRDGKKIIRPWGRSADGKGWQRNLDHAPKPRPLYRLPSIPTAELVCIHEGEKAAVAATKAKLPGTHTTTIGGAENARNSDFMPLQGKAVVVVPDNDEPGERYGEQVAKLAHEAGAKSVKIVRLPDLPEKGDVVEWLDAGGDAKAWADLIEQAPFFNVETTQQNQQKSDEWQPPQPLTASYALEPYPLDALPSTVRAAVEEVVGFVKAPVPMVASSALAALSLAIQAHVDVERAEKLHGPTGLFLLTIADSGERKSTCDGFFTKAIRDYEAEQAEAAKPELKRYKADIEAWEARQSGIKDKIRHLARDNKPTANMESALRNLEQDKPEPPRVPRLMYADATPEALAHGLAKQWPSGGVVSAEAGIVFGSHGMGKDSVMRNLATLNQLWDGTSLTIDRRTSESFTVQGARLTVALQVQEPTLQEFLSKSGALARGSGFLARFLVAWPASTQGFRPFTEAPENWPALASFNQRLAAILNQSEAIDDDGALTPAMLSMSLEAKAAWVEYHDAIESELASGGELYNVRDVASKSADNAARLAALFQMFEHGTGAVSADCFESASRITAWHLSEARRFFGELALPPELADAARLDGWLIDYCRRERTETVNKRYLRQHGPVRDGARLDSAIMELMELDRLRLQKDGRRIDLAVNPALLEVGA